MEIETKQTHRCGNQTSDYQLGEGRAEEKDRGRGLRDRTTMYKINKLQRYIVQHKNIANIL